MPRLYEIKKGVYRTSDGKVITSKQITELKNQPDTIVSMLEEATNTE